MMTSRFRIVLAAGFLFFITAFFALHLKEVVASGSWKYVLMHNDEYGYWAFTRGAAETPVSDGNPFYFEQKGDTHTVPFTTTLLIGRLAHWLHLPVMVFYPVWHILMPFFLWAVLLLCLYRIWGFQLYGSALAALAILASTLYISGPAQFTLYRFSRPGDGLWILYLWISIIMNRPPQDRKSAAILGALSFAAFWFHPYYILAGIVVSALECSWRSRQGERNATLILGGILIGTVLAAAAYYFYIQLNMGSNPWVFITNETHPGRTLSSSAILLYLLILFLVFFSRHCLRQPRLDRFDRLLLFLFLIEPLTAHAHWILPGSFQIASHRYYFLTLEIAALTGWLFQKLPGLLAWPPLAERKRTIALMLALWAGILMAWPDTNFFRYFPVLDSHYDMKDNAQILLGLFPLILFSVTAALQLKHAAARRRHLAAAGVVLLCLGGFWMLPSQVHDSNTDYPFDGAVEWFQQHAEPDEVVLTIPPDRRWKINYLILHTPLKSYFNAWYGQTLSDTRETRLYRIQFYTLLLLGWLDRIPLRGYDSIAEKLQHLRLDYLLIDKPSYFQSTIEKSLEGWLTPVYEDENCLIWEVRKTASAG